MSGVKYSFVRGNTSGIDEAELIDGQILFDKEKKLIALDAIVDDTLTRIVMAEQTFSGTTVQWQALSDAQKAVFKYVYIVDDYIESAGRTIYSETEPSGALDGDVWVGG